MKMASATPSSRNNLQVIEGGREAENTPAPAEIARERYERCFSLSNLKYT